MSSESVKITFPPVTCPTCRKVEVPRSDTNYPFCSERCRTSDLSAWASGAYAIPAVDDVDDQIGAVDAEMGFDEEV